MYINGFIIQEYIENGYKGIDGSGFSKNTGRNWFLEDKELEDYYDEHIGLTYYDIEDSSWIAVCNDINFIRKYIKKAEEQKIPYRILLVESDIPNPILEYDDFEKVFLGYDYAYATGDNYSALYNEVPYIFSKFKLNNNGLFETEEEIREYIKVREKFINENPPLTLESGDFAVMRLYEVKL